MAMLNPTSSHHLKLSVLPSTSYVPTFLQTSSPTNGGPLAPRQLVYYLCNIILELCIIDIIVYYINLVL